MVLSELTDGMRVRKFNLKFAFIQVAGFSFDLLCKIGSSSLSLPFFLLVSFSRSFICAHMKRIVKLRVEKM